MVSLRSRIEGFIARDEDPLKTLEEFYELLEACVQDGTAEGMACVRRLFEAPYTEAATACVLMKEPAAGVLLIWREAGVQALADATASRLDKWNLRLGIPLLARVAAGAVSEVCSSVRHDGLARLVNELTTAPGMAQACRRHLIQLVLSFESDDEVAERIGGGFSFLLPSEVPATKELFAALSARWLAVSTPVLARYTTLVADRPNDEPAFQRFLGDHPQLLDPMAAQVWPQPDLFGSRFPDFVVRRTDGSYLVVEIECPGKLLVAGNGRLSADAAHAEQQALDYRSYLMEHVADARLHFPDFDDPDCLVVIGLEGVLEPRRKRALRDANRARHRLRIVGFDWLADRARAVSANIVSHQIAVGRLRIT